MLKESREIKTFRHLMRASVTKACRFAIVGILLALFFSVKVTAESSTGFPPSPGFPESSAAKELSGLDDVLSCSFMFCLLSGCHRQPFGRALATLARFLCGILLGMSFL